MLTGKRVKGVGPERICVAKAAPHFTHRHQLNEPISIRLPSGAAMEQGRWPQGLVVDSKTDTALGCFLQVFYWQGKNRVA